MLLRPPSSIQLSPATSRYPLNRNPTTTVCITPIMMSCKSQIRIRALPTARCRPRLRIVEEEEEEEEEDDDDDDSPVSVELEPIITEQHFNRITHDSQHQLLILWCFAGAIMAQRGKSGSVTRSLVDLYKVSLPMATWCRKCIYLKPKLEKLAADYHPRIRFYCIDVNAVPHKLVARAGVTKMPTIQVWKGSKKQAEVIGGQKAYLVINDIREMIEDVGSP